MKNTMGLEEYKAKLDAGVYDYQYKADYEEMVQQYSEVFKKWQQARDDADRQRELLEKALPYLVDYQHIFEGECIEDMNILSYFIEDIEEELADD